MLWTWEDEEMRREEAGKAIRWTRGDGKEGWWMVTKMKMKMKGRRLAALLGAGRDGCQTASICT